MPSGSTTINSGCEEPKAICVKILMIHMAGPGSIAKKDSRCPMAQSMLITTTAGTARIQSEITGSLAFSVSAAGLKKAATRSNP